MMGLVAAGIILLNWKDWIGQTDEEEEASSHTLSEQFEIGFYKYLHSFAVRAVNFYPTLTRSLLYRDTTVSHTYLTLQ